MAAMTTVLTEFSTYGNSRTSTLANHTAAMPELVIEKRKVPEGNQTMAEKSFKVVKATVDADGAIIAQKVSFEGIARYPISGQEEDIDDALAVFRDVVAGDEFGNSVKTLGFM